MSPSIISFPTIFFTSSILILISTNIFPVQCRNPNYAPAPTPTPTPSPSPIGLIQHTCYDDNYRKDVELCLRVLESIPRVASAKDAQSFAIAVIESGISNSKKTLEHIKALSSRRRRGGVKVALDYCISEYNRVVEDFEHGVDAIKRHVYDLADYLLMTSSGDYVPLCEAALAKHNFKDEVIAEGNKLVPMFALAARQIVDELYNSYRYGVAPAPTPY